MTASAAGLHWTPIATALLFLLSSGLPCRADSNHQHSKWSYDETQSDGPSKWPVLFKQCNGAHQSPVDLGNAVEMGDLSGLDLQGYDGPLKEATLINDGHTVMIQFKESPASLRGGCLRHDDWYDLEQIHFHWGNKSSRGSEHTIDGKPFSMEGHLVHRNRRYPNVPEAVKHSDGLAVLGIFYQVSGVNSSHLSQLVAAVEEATRLGVNHKVKGRLDGMTLRSLLPVDVSNFYCYRDGSLTTPLCNEAVTWTLIEKPVHIGSRQMSSFRRLIFENGSPLVDNFRPVQKLNGRTVYFRNSSWSALPSLPLLLISLILLLSSSAYSSSSSSCTFHSRTASWPGPALY